MQQNPAIGRIVHYVLREGASKGEVRPAIITRVVDPVTLNLNVQLDGGNDTSDTVHPVKWEPGCVMTTPDAKKGGGWYWPPRV